MTDVVLGKMSLRERTAEEIRALLARRRMSATSLAKHLGMSQTYMWRRLNGETAFDLDDLERIASFLEVRVIDLIPQPDGNSPTLRYRATTGRSKRRPLTPLPVHRSPVVGRPDTEASRPNGRPQPDPSPQPLRRPAIRRRRAMA